MDPNDNEMCAWLEVHTQNEARSGGAGRRLKSHQPKHSSVNMAAPATVLILPVPAAIREHPTAPEIPLSRQAGCRGRGGSEGFDALACGGTHPATRRAWDCNNHRRSVR